ncbi:hypothetical protein MtrunA17_Chr2g0300951 [Medicago truncatula]|uniref:Uncharacterized protein n=1 Tax=Medicago truncatula TaxID=3880 RepID=A0A396J8I8_MEDTR|nr:hypothetical protein MtrunA17_Chr2g0300951 [Medicago truncatula]
MSENRIRPGRYKRKAKAKILQYSENDSSIFKIFQDQEGVP